VVGGAVPVALAWHFGALGIPRNDDRLFAFSAFRFADSGTITGSGWAGMNLVGQLVLAAPVVRLFGHRLSALQVEVAVIGVGGLLATYWLAKQLVRPRLALFVALLVATSPFWTNLSVSFMTDVPSYALAMACLALGATSVARSPFRTGYLCASLAVGFCAFTIRESTVVAPLAVAVVAGARPEWRARKRWGVGVAMAGGFLVAAALFYRWRRTLPGYINPHAHAPSLHLVDHTVQDLWQWLLLVGVLAGPAVLLADPIRLLRAARARAPRTAVAAGAATAGLLALALAGYGVPDGVVGPGDYILANGSLGTEMVHGSRPDLLPRGLLGILAVGGALSLVVLVSAAAAPLARGAGTLRRRQQPTAPPALFIVAFAAAGFVVTAALPELLGYSENLFDRYLLPLVPLVAILVLRAGAKSPVLRPARVAGVAALAVLALLGVGFAANSASFDAANWSVATRAVEITKDPTRVDAGHIWNDYHAHRHLRGPFRGACVEVRVYPQLEPGASGVIAARRVRGFAGTQAWVVARRVAPCR